MFLSKQTDQTETRRMGPRQPRESSKLCSDWYVLTLKQRMSKNYVTNNLLDQTFKLMNIITYQRGTIYTTNHLHTLHKCQALSNSKEIQYTRAHGMMDLSIKLN